MTPSLLKRGADRTLCRPSSPPAGTSPTSSSPFPDERMSDGMKTGVDGARGSRRSSRPSPPAVNYKNQNMLFNIQSTREVIIWNTQKVKGGRCAEGMGRSVRSQMERARWG